MRIVPLTVSLQALYFTLFYNVEVFTNVLLLEHKNSIVEILHLKTINKFKFVVLVKSLEQVNLLYELQFNVPSVNSALDDDVFEYFPFDSPNHALICRSHTSCSLLIVQ